MNLEPAFSPIYGKLEAGDAQILIVGDSLSRKGWNFPFADQMQEIWGDGGSGYQGLVWHNDGGFNGGAWDVHNIGEDREPYSSLDGLWAQTTAGAPAKGAANHAVLTPWQLGPFDLQFISQPGGGRFNLLHDTPNGRQLLATIDTAADVEGLSVWKGTSEGRLVFQPLDEGKPVKILGINQQNPEGVRIDRAAADGWDTGNFLHRDWTFDAQLAMLGADLAIIALGANEATSAESVGYEQRLEQLADRVLASSPDATILLMPPYHYAESAVLSGMTDAALAVAERRGFGFINLYDSAGTPDFFAANEFLRDWIHWNDAGSAYIASEVIAALTTAGRSLDFPSADVTGDQRVDLSDFGVLKDHMGLPLATIQQGDLTRDAKVDLADFGRLKAGFNGAAAVPEPAAWLLAAIGAAVIIFRTSGRLPR